uniref:Uncharacterized protein n=1 Tax=Timema cristinae TaxID=61476 RepID=A0A7R9CX82_TIMCR|nr:unnamed protein product [Timema cristinae]
MVERVELWFTQNNKVMERCLLFFPHEPSLDDLGNSRQGPAPLLGHLETPSHHQTSPAFRTSFIVRMSSSSSSISSSPSSSLDSCYSMITSASSRVYQTVMSSFAAKYSSYVQSGANL